MLHKLRRAMVRPGRERLSGRVEVDETYVGGEEPNVAGRHTETKAIVAVAVEVHQPRGFGRIRLRLVPNVTGPTLEGFVARVVERGSVVVTDGWQGYGGLKRRGYEHVRLVRGKDPRRAHVAMPGVHRVSSLLKRWLLGTHQGAVRPEHLNTYLDEFTFRFNRRSSRSRGLLLYRLLEQAVVAPPSPYRSIVVDHKM
jgi:transposase-like protein